MISVKMEDLKVSQKEDFILEYTMDGKKLNGTYDIEGAKMTIKDGLLHSENDEPAITTKDGIKTWYKEGKIHRENAPAIISSTEKIYVQDGVEGKKNNFFQKVESILDRIIGMREVKSTTSVKLNKKS